MSGVELGEYFHKDYSSDELSIDFGDSISKELIRLSNSNDKTLFIVLTSSIIALFKKSSFEVSDNILLRTPILSKFGGDLNNVINKLLIQKGEISKETTFKDLLISFKNDYLSSMKHQNYPLEKFIRDELHNEESFYENFSLLTNIHDEKILDDFKYNLAFCFSRGVDDYISCKIKYNANSFKNETI
ncbi:MAG: hypothetical protein GQ534_02240 [Candidatus Delongbacteria bacterium]|nr:hypothetical protein [Candidatus Delongbacteria bacterium]